MTVQGKWLGVLVFGAVAVGMIVGGNLRDIHIALCFSLSFLLAALHHKD